MLVYVWFFILTFAGVALSSHNVTEPLCPENQHYTQNNPRCIRTCANKSVPMSDDCKPFTGCVCDGDLMRFDDDGRGPCVPEHKCPCRDDSKNPDDRVYTDHAEAIAYAEAAQEETISDCDGKSIIRSSSKSSSLSKSSSYTSVVSSNCGGKECSDPNAAYKDRLNACPLTCAKPNPAPCNKMPVNKGGCECVKGFVLNEDTGICVRPKDCPGNCRDPNTVYTDCRNECPLSCDHPFPKTCTKACKKSGCECAPGFILDLDDQYGKCIRPEDCPKPISCPKHSHYVINDNQCPKTCGNRLLPYSDVASACVPFTGCVCKPRYVRKHDNATGPCIKATKCTPIPTQCGVNEVPTSCAIVCPPQKCESLYSKYYCLPTECEPGCDCQNGFLRNKVGVCIPSQDCFKSDPSLSCNGDFNATLTVCPNNCPKTCDDPYAGDDGCIEICRPTDCQCNLGYFLTKLDGGICIKPEDCESCKGDKKAKYSYCPSACEPTCANPDRNQVCTKQCMPPGCVCRDGYVLNQETGKCTKPENCPSGCGGDTNAVHSTCPTACESTCDNKDPQICTLQCLPPGCVCKPGFVKSKDGKCIKPETCPVVDKGCNGDLNATHSDCPSSCPPTCENRNSDHKVICPAVCDPSGCVCKPGFILTKKGGKCVLPQDCPGCKGDKKAKHSDCPSACEPTCANPDRNQVCTKQCMPPGCVCRDGYVLNQETGKCTKPENCPKSGGCGGDTNAVHSTCPTACESTCDNKDPQICTLQCLPPGCVCKPGFVKSKDGKCIKPEACPVVDKGCNGDLNATHSDCPSSCPPTCENRNSDEKVLCPAVCDPSGCVCKQGFILTKKGGKCVLPQDCPVPGCKDSNAMYKECPSACEPTCSNQNPKFCTKQCMPPGCVCKPDYVLNEKTGKCVKPENCPADSGCKGDMNATFSDCTSRCPTTCADRYGGGEIMYCPAVCGPPGCVCKPEYILNVKGGVCVLPEDCPVPGCGGDGNAVYSTCPSACESTCDNQNPQICTLQCLPPGCVCKPGFVKSIDGKCIKPESCPVIGCGGDPNAMHSQCPRDCEPTCTNLYPICTGECRPPGCVCKPGFVWARGKCIRPESCPAEPQCKGDRNATYTQNPISYCQATCKSPDAEGQCMDMPMPSGCVCKHGYLLREKGGPCIKPEDCPGGWPTCRANETYVNCKVPCPNNICPVDDSLAIIACDPIYPCPGGCACKEGYLMVSQDDNTCILSSECQKVECKRPGEAWDPHAPGCLHERCDDKDIPCDFQYPGRPRCRCIEGYYRNQDDICVPECQCPKLGCNGDLNATLSKRPSKCPPTCCKPDRTCDADYDYPGCVCNDGFILSKPGGPCISPYDCDGGSPHCCDNMTYTSCKIDCLMMYCPQDENEITMICDPVWPCPSGCECKAGYLMTNTGNKTCILAKDCPPLVCTGPNEEWDCTPSTCNYERCDEMYYTCDDPSPGRPKCVCKEGYYRDNDGVCIPAEQCLNPEPICGYNEVAVPCRQICPPQNCEIAYTEYACTEETKICEPGCDCLPDHLRNGSGICVPNDQCPYPSTPVCGINEIARDCRRICPPQTCQSKYIMYNCIQDLPCEPGCDCVPNYLRDDRGICIPSEKCPPAPKPELICGYNEVAVPCRQICPPQNCEIAYTDYACTEETKICEPGCDCLPDHLRNGSGICIPNNQCPYPSTPVCGINEIARDCRRICPPQTCLSKYALFRCVEDVPCEPGCDCVPNYLRDERGICIRSEQCPAPCQISDECKRTCKKPNPQNCVYNPPKVNMKGCDCKEGYILSELGGDCIPIDQCPPEIACHGDSNARPKRCPKPCPSTCQSPNQFPCKRMCVAIGCECKSGYLLSNNTDSARCILPDKCPGGNPCGKGGRFADCKTDCERDYCPTNDSRDPVYCESSETDCLSGCICDVNYKRKSREDPRCIVSNKCRPVNCTRPYEKWCSCPSACLAENCEDINNQPTVCYTLVLNCEPRCICKKNHFRNSSGICVPAKKCPPPGCGGDPRAVYSEFPSACERTCDNADPQICTDQCMPAGCVCKQGFVLNKKDEKCIELENCPVPECEDPNAVSKECTSACEPTCANPDPQSCTDQCMPAGCVCKEGFVLNEKDGKCTEPCNCPDC